MAGLAVNAARLTQFTHGLTQRRVAFGQTILKCIVKAPAHHLLHSQIQAFGIKQPEPESRRPER
jgi:hypothetical protein